MSSSRRLSPVLAAALAALASTALVFAACGKQGPPLPPMRPIPAPTRDLAVAQHGTQIALTFGYPKTTPGGQALAGGITKIEVVEATLPASSEFRPVPLDPRQFQGAAKVIVKLSGKDLSEAVTGDRIEVDLPLPATTQLLPSDAPIPAPPPPPPPPPVRPAVAAAAAAAAAAAGTPSGTATKPGAPPSPGAPPTSPETGLATAPIAAPAGPASGPPTPTAIADPSVPAATAPATPPAAASPAKLPAPIVAGPPAHYYAVRTYGPKGDKSELSNQAILVPRVTPTAPDKVTVTARADGLFVEWTGAPGLSGYNVYRRNAQEKTHGAAIHGAAANDKSYLDNGAAFGQSYIYSVTSVATREPVVESATATEREIHYVDRFPPPPPADLVVLPETGRTRLIWRVSEAADLAGYVVYRRQGSEDDWVRITKDPIDKPEYNDTTALPNRAHFYRVTALDKSGNESAPSAEVRAAVAP